MTEAGGLLDSEEVDFLLSTGSGKPKSSSRGKSSQSQAVTMRGDLDQINLADIFQTLAISKMEGVLRVRNPLEQREVYFREGMVRCLVPARVEVRRLGQMLIQAGMIDTEQLRSALLTQKKVRKPIGQILIQEGAVTEEQIEAVANSQITEDLYNLFTWKHGSFEFYRGPCSDPLLAQRLEKLPEFDVNSVLLEVARRSDEWVVILEAVHSLDEVPVPTGVSDPGVLDKDHQNVLRAVDGHLNIREVADTCLMGLFDCARIIRDLFAAGVLQPASTEQIVKVAEAWLKRGEMKRALVTVQTLYDRPDDRDLATIMVVADLLKRCGESRMAASVLLEAAEHVHQPEEALDLVRQAKQLNPRNSEILGTLQQLLRESDHTHADELSAVTGSLVDALRDEGHLEEALTMVEELEEMQPGTSAVLTRRVRILQRLKRPEEAIANLEALAKIYIAEKKRDLLIGTYEQILKLDHDRRDIARALKKLRAGRLGSHRRLLLTLILVLVAGGVGGWVMHTQKQTTALEQLRNQVEAFLRKSEPRPAMQLVIDREMTHGASAELTALRARIQVAIDSDENRRIEERREAWQTRLGEAGELLNAGRCVEAMAIYAELRKDGPTRMRVEEAMGIRLASLITHLEKLERDLRHAVPESPDDLEVLDSLQETLAQIELDFSAKDRAIGQHVLDAEGDENLIAMVPKGRRNSLMTAAHAVGELFEQAHTRREEYRSAINASKTTRDLQPVFQRAREFEKLGQWEKALAEYRKLKEKYPRRDNLRERFEERVKYYSTMLKYQRIIERATARGDSAVARNQYRALKREFPNIPFPNVRLPVRVETTPSKATVFLNGQEKGISPLNLAYSPLTETTIRVELDGFYPEEAKFEGDANEKIVSLLSKTHIWTLKLPGTVEQAPVADGEGRVFVADRSGTVTAIRSSDGEELWSLDTHDLNGLLPTPVIQGDRVVVASIDGTLRSIDRRTGKLRWSNEDLPCEVPPVNSGATLVLVTTDNELVGVHPGTGKVTYRVPLPGDTQTAPVVIGSHVFAVSTSGRVQKFNSSNGAAVWPEDRPVGRGVLSPPTVTPAGLVYPADDGSLTLLDPGSGRQIWKKSGTSEIVLPVEYKNDVLYVAQGTTLQLRRLRDGSEIRSTRGQAQWSSPPAVLGGALLVGNRDGQVYVMDPAKLGPKYQIRGSGRITVAPLLVPGGPLVIAFENGQVYGFRFP